MDQSRADIATDLIVRFSNFLVQILHGYLRLVLLRDSLVFGSFLARLIPGQERESKRVGEKKKIGKKREKKVQNS